jgi:Tfp pilus assembly protein PilN
MRKKKKNSGDQQIGIEISQNDVSLIVIEQKTDGRAQVRGRRVAWRKEAKDIAEEGGAAELVAAINDFVADEELAGMSVHVALNSNYCVTRVAAGEREKVEDELQVLHDRSNQYLMLGPGEKALARSLLPIDAKQIQGWLTVTNRDTLDVIVDSLEQANLKVDLIEHAMVSLCRAVTRMPSQDDSPTIIVELNERGVDVGVAYKGRLLFDYRPGGLKSKNQVAQIIKRHLERIQRYCSRHFPFAEGDISQVFICGATEDVAEVRKELDEVSDLKSTRLSPQSILAECGFSSDDVDYDDVVAPLGAALLDQSDLVPSADERGIANLLDFVRSVRHEPLIPGLAKLAWPIVATLGVAILLFIASMLESSGARGYAYEQEQLDDQMAKVQRMRSATAVANVKILHLQKIESGALNPGWHKLLSMLGRSMAEPVWLDGIRVEQDGAMTISGPSRTEDAIFEFVRYLQKIPEMNDVNLESQVPAPREPWSGNANGSTTWFRSPKSANKSSCPAAIRYSDSESCHAVSNACSRATTKFSWLAATKVFGHATTTSSGHSAQTATQDKYFCQKADQNASHRSLAGEQVVEGSKAG